MDVLNRMLQVARKHDDTELMGNIFKKISQVQMEEQEHRKLKAQADVADIEATTADIVTAKLNGKFVTGSIREQDGVDGLQYYNPESDTVEFTPFGPHLIIQTGGAGGRGSVKSDSERVRQHAGNKRFAETQNMIETAREGLAKYTRVMNNLTQFYRSGRVQPTLGGAGSILTWTDNFLRGIQGIANSAGIALDGGVASQDIEPNEADGFSGYSGWRAQLKDPNSRLWSLISLPESMSNDAQNAQIYAANIMDLAFMAARMAEPSNRGLSDKDIAAALVRLGGSSAAPEVIMTRFMELIHEGSNNIRNRLQTYYGAVHRGDGSVLSNDEINRIFGGQGLPAYFSELDRTHKRFWCDL